MFYILAEYAPVGFLSCTAGGEVLYANKKLLEIMGSPSLDATKSINLLTFPKLVEAGFSGKLKECIEKERNIEFEMEYTSLWGKTSWLRVHFTPNRDEQHVSGANIVLNDITKSKNSEEALKEIAHRDALTKAYNRNVLDTVLADRLYESKSKGFIGCFAVVDVDGFKSINDTYGHKAGDSVLKHLAANVKEVLRENDMVVRTGGDEFLIYLHDVKDKDNAQTAVKRLFDAVSGEYLLEKDAMGPAVRLHVRCSIGASLFPEDGKTVETLMAKADDALYAVKKSGKADVRFAGD
jgi:diguanylate cyclase (GGDEF)-like protein/PAS domain S-box-containing protein